RSNALHEAVAVLVLDHQSLMIIHNRSFFFSSRRRHTRSVSAFLLNRSSDLERKKRDEIEAGKSYCSRRFGGATCDDKSAQIYARFDKNDWRIQPAEFYRFHDAEVNTFGYF